MASRVEIERIRAMQEKGTITAEQADELIEALSAAPEEKDESRAEWDPRFVGYRRLQRSKWVPDWVKDMVDEAAAPGVLGGMGSEEYDSAAGTYEYRYRYDWDPSYYWRRMGVNAQDVSRVERPEGEEFKFRDNKFAFSKLRSMRLVRSTVRNNAFYAATIHDLDLEESTLVDSSFAGASLHDLSMVGSEMKNVRFEGMKLKELSIRENSSIKTTKVSGGYIKSLKLDGGSRIEGGRMVGMKVMDVRLSGSELTDAVFNGMCMQDWKIEGSKLSGCRIEKIGMFDVGVKNSVLRGVAFRQEFEGTFNRVKDFSIEDSTLESCEFVECTIRNTRIKGISVKGLRIYGKDLTGLTFQKSEDLEALAEKQAPGQGA